MNQRVEFIEEAARCLIEYQKKLSDAYREKLQCTQNIDRADLRTDGELWRYFRHGIGVNFIRYSDELSVDMEKDVGEPEKFSAWRLALFLESKNLYFEETMVQETLTTSKNFVEEDGFFKVKNSKKLFDCG